MPHTTGEQPELERNCRGWNEEDRFCALLSPALSVRCFLTLFSHHASTKQLRKGGLSPQECLRPSPSQTAPHPPVLAGTKRAVGGTPGKRNQQHGRFLPTPAGAGSTASGRGTSAEHAAAGGRAHLDWLPDPGALEARLCSGLLI